MARADPAAGSAEPDFGFAAKLLHVLAVIMAALLFAMMMMTAVDVAGRYFFNAPLPGSVEVTEYSLALLIFGGLPLATMQREHITIDLFDFLLPGRRKIIQQFIVNLISAGVLAFLTWRLVEKALELASYGDLSSFLKMPLAPFAYFFSVMSGVTTLLLIAFAVHYGRLLFDKARPSETS